MSFAELKRQVPRLTRKQRRELYDLLAEAARADGSEWIKELDRRMERMDAGQKFTAEDLQRRHAELVARGH